MPFEPGSRAGERRAASVPARLQEYAFPFAFFPAVHRILHHVGEEQIATGRDPGGAFGPTMIVGDLLQPRECRGTRSSNLGSSRVMIGSRAGRGWSWAAVAVVDADSPMLPARSARPSTHDGSPLSPQRHRAHRASRGTPLPVASLCVSVSSASVLKNVIELPPAGSPGRIPGTLTRSR